MESFEGLNSKYSNFSHCLQIRHYLPKKKTYMLQMCLSWKQPIPKNFTSHVYETVGLNFNYSADHIRNQWQIDI